MCYGRGVMRIAAVPAPAPGSCIRVSRLLGGRHRDLSCAESSTMDTQVRPPPELLLYAIWNVKLKYNCCRNARLPATRIWRLWTERCLPTPARTPTASTAAPAGVAAEVSKLKKHSPLLFVPEKGPYWLLEISY